MAVLRDRPYAQFNFLVDLGTGATDGPEAGFQECGGISMSVDVIEYRNGNEKENDPRKLTGLARVSDVTLKRGIIGSLGLYKWIDQIRNGDAAGSPHRRHPDAERGSHGDRDDVEAAPRQDHQAHERTVERERDRRRDGGTHARLRTARARVATKPAETRSDSSRARTTDCQEWSSCQTASTSPLTDYDRRLESGRLASLCFVPLPFTAWWCL